MGNPSLDSIVNGWRAHFFAADRQLNWTFAERKIVREIAPGVRLRGIIDAGGTDTTGQPFFGEWKTANPRKKNTWKQIWRMNPQSLTYGVLLRDEGVKRFTVRQAFKTDPPSFDHAWYSYSDAELAMWEGQLVKIAEQIKAGEGVPWPMNLKACFEYGPEYACPFFESACSKLDWQGKPKDAIVRISPSFDGVVYTADDIELSATRVQTWLECRERFRRYYVDNIDMPPSAALTMGGDFHQAIGAYYSSLVQGAH